MINIWRDKRLDRIAVTLIGVKQEIYCHSNLICYVVSLKKGAGKSEILTPRSAPGGAPPQWATQIMEDLKHKIMSSKLTALKKKKKKNINTINSKVKTLEARRKSS